MINAFYDRKIWYGLTAAILYVAAALVTSAGRPALLFDGLGPLPRYNWVQPPPVLARGNIQPESAQGRLTIFRAVEGQPGVSIPAGTQSGSLSTPDGQATVLFVRAAFPPLRDEPSVTIMFTPLDPQPSGPLPAHLRFDGNAYRFEAVYSNSRTPAPLQRPTLIFLRYASGGSVILQLDGNVWQPLSGRRYEGSSALEAEVSALGTFVAAAPKDHPYTRRAPWWTYAIFIGLLLPPVLIIAWVLYKTMLQSRKRPAAG